MAIPNKRAVSQAIKLLHKALKQTIKETNLSAAELAKKGNYERAEAAMAKGRQLMDFRVEIAGLEKKWKEVSGSGSTKTGASNEVSTAAWQYYAPILRSLVTLDGKSALKDIETEFLGQMDSHLRSGDRDAMSGGRQRWQVMIHRARKHMIKEGWLTAKSSKLWEITAAGRKVAEKPSEF